MSNPYYTESGAPTTLNRGASSVIRNEFILVRQGFDTVASAFTPATSTTSLTIAVASKTFQTQTGKSFVAGQFVTAASAASSANYMHGQVTSYSGTTLVVDVLDVGGSGTYADWSISIAGPSGADFNLAKDVSGGIAGLTLYKVNFNDSSTGLITSFLTNNNTAARTYAFQDRSGTIVDTADLVASSIANTPAGNVVAVTVQAAINELDTDLSAHINDPTDAHAASAITNTPAGNIAATTVQAALNELDSEKALLAGSTGQAFSTSTATLGSNTTLAASTAFVTQSRSVGAKYAKFDAADLIGTPTTITSAVTKTNDNNFMTIGSSSGTITITFLIAGDYELSFGNSITHTNVYSAARVNTTIGGTATRYSTQTVFVNSGDASDDIDSTLGQSILISATAGQTVTLVATFELTGAGVTTAHYVYQHCLARYIGATA